GGVAGVLHEQDVDAGQVGRLEVEQLDGGVPGGADGRLLTGGALAQVHVVVADHRGGGAVLEHLQLGAGARGAPGPPPGARGGGGGGGGGAGPGGGGGGGAGAVGTSSRWSCSSPITAWGLTSEGSIGEAFLSVTDGACKSRRSGQGWGVGGPDYRCGLNGRPP